MSVALSLLAYAVVLGLAGPLLLCGRGATRLSPRLGLRAWSAAALSVVGAGMAGGLAVAVPALPHGLDELVAACTHPFPGGVTSAGGVAVRASGLALAGAVAARVGWCVVTSLVTAARQRRRHREAVRIVARPSARPGTVVLDSDLALVYCLPGRGDRVVVTRGALRVLSGRELDAVLAHEDAHLRGRHHLVLSVLQGLSRAFPGVPLFRRAGTEVRRLLEMRADDVAAARHSRGTVIAALSALGRVPAPAASLAAAATAVEERLRRLTAPLETKLLPRVALATGVAFLMTGPVLAAAAPMVAELVHHLVWCPTG